MPPIVLRESKEVLQPAQPLQSQVVFLLYIKVTATQVGSVTPNEFVMSATPVIPLEPSLLQHSCQTPRYQETLLPFSDLSAFPPLGMVILH